jgi:hypothetical protein
VSIERATFVPFDCDVYSESTIAIRGSARVDGANYFFLDRSKRTDCTFCKHECPRVVFTASPTALFSSLPASSTPFSDAKLGLAFETREQMEDTLALLRFNCPSSTCPSILLGWSDLKRHTRNDHNLALCDFCCTNKKIFTHEHELYTNEGLGKHMDDNHPYCGFCRIHFYDSDLLYAHCRDRHEECFICTRQGIRHQYHLNYDRLVSFVPLAIPPFTN